MACGLAHGLPNGVGPARGRRGMHVAFGRRARSSIGQSSGLIIRQILVRVQAGPCFRAKFRDRGHRAGTERISRVPASAAPRSQSGRAAAGDARTSLGPLRFRTSVADRLAPLRAGLGPGPARCATRKTRASAARLSRPRSSAGYACGVPRWSRRQRRQVMQVPGRRRLDNTLRRVDQPRGIRRQPR